MDDNSTRVFCGPHARDFLTDRWRYLYRQSPNCTPYQSSEWLLGWLDQQPSVASPLVLAYFDSNGCALAALALARFNDALHPRIAPLSAPMAEYVRPVGPGAEDPYVAASFLCQLQRLAVDERVDLTDVPADSALGLCMSQASSGVRLYGSSPCAHVSLPLDLHSLSRSTRREHRRRERVWVQMATEHDVRYGRTRGPEELVDAFRDLCRLHQARWSEQARLPGVSLSAESQQWETVLKKCPQAFISTIAIGGSVVAAQLCLQQGDTVFSVIPAMDPAYKNVAVGHALLRALIADLTSIGAGTLDLGRTVEGQTYKSQYAPEWSKTLSAQLTPCLSAAQGSGAHESVPWALQ
ncbi:GNAT family N-acetyltransferase [Streptomyces sp. NPDC093589]|uniref:GNAT family N-acetyltransferase n=1 Tax=Streptomyces sp. NPDC093589 TaxID=3366043 RepID=UPI00380A9DB1